MRLSYAGGMVSNVQATYFGTSTVYLHDGATSVLIDGFLSRPSLPRVLFTRIGPDARRIDAGLRRSNVDRVDALFVAHSHYDHALDAPTIAQRFNAPLYGSASTLNLGRGADLPEMQLHLIEQGSIIEVGAFTVRVFETPHSPGDTFPGTIDEPLRLPARASALRTGACFSFHIAHPDGSMVIVPSANFTPGTFEGLSADVAYLGIGALGRQKPEFQRAYWRETVEVTAARLIIPVHWDHFGRDLSRPLRPLPRPFDNVARARRFLDTATAGTPAICRFQDRFETLRPFELANELSSSDTVHDR